MKHQLPILLFFCFPLLDYGQNLAANADFEMLDSMQQNGTGFLSWYGNSNISISIDSVVRHGGRYSLRMEIKKAFGTGKFLQHISLAPGENLHRVTVSGWLKREKVGPWQFAFTGLWLQVFQRNQPIAFRNMYSRHLKDSRGWHKFSISTIADNEATDVQLGGEISGDKGIVWFDDMEVKIEPLYPGTARPKVVSFINKALDLMEQKAINRDSIEWLQLRRKILTLAVDYRNVQQAQGLICTALQRLNDIRAMQVSECSCNIPNAYRKTKLKGKMLDEGIAYLTIPALYNENSTYDATKIRETRELIKSLDQQGPKGWVLDLRQNNAGNNLPMLHAVSPLLGDGIVGYMIGPDDISKEMACDHGNVLIEHKKACSLEGTSYQLHTPLSKLAVLVGPNTFGAAESVAIAFKGRTNCRSFGKPTAGQSALYSQIPIDKYHFFFLSTTAVADRNKTVYRSKFIPDEIFENDDDMLEAIKKWLLN